jgi:glycosyltransferase involved in cell wall biosynthesis
MVPLLHNTPLVSIIIPTYNYARFLGKALSSCFDQTYQNLEVIVVDDGSTDNTKQVIEPFNERIVYLYQENQGVSTARNRGLDRAKGDHIAFLDADDYLLKDSVGIRVDILQKHPEVDTVFTDTLSVDTEGNFSREKNRSKDSVSDRFYEDLLLRHLRFQTSAVMIRSTLAKQFSFPVHLSNGEDIVYFSKVLFAGKAYFCAQSTVVNLHHEDSLRHDVHELTAKRDLFLRTILDDPFYKGKLKSIKKALTAKRHLEVFRRLYLSGEMKLAREEYRKALKVSPACILHTSYLSKALRSFIK